MVVYTIGAARSSLYYTQWLCHESPGYCVCCALHEHRDVAGIVFVSSRTHELQQELEPNLFTAHVAFVTVLARNCALPVNTLRALHAGLRKEQPTRCRCSAIHTPF